MEPEQAHVPVPLLSTLCLFLLPSQLGHQARHGGLEAGKGVVIGPGTRDGAAALIQPAVIAPIAALHMGGVIQRAETDLGMRAALRQPATSIRSS